MNAITIYLDEQWVNAISGKDPRIAARVFAEALTHRFPALTLQYLGITKLELFYDEKNIHSRDLENTLRSVLRNQFQLDAEYMDVVLTVKYAELDPSEYAEDTDEYPDNFNADTDSQMTIKDPAEMEDTPGSGNSHANAEYTTADTDTQFTTTNTSAESAATYTEPESTANGAETESGTTGADAAPTAAKAVTSAIASAPRLPGGYIPEGGPALKKIRKLRGYDSLVQLCNSIHAMLPYLRSNARLLDVLDDRVYLFSVNIGVGMTAPISDFFDYLVEEQMIPGNGGGCELRISPDTGEYLSLNDAKAYMAQSEASLFCIDITDWVDDIDDSAFRDFLLYLYAQDSECRFIFKMPYLEKKVINHVASVLGDIFTLDTIVLPPLPEEFLIRSVEDQLKDYGFRADADAMELFRKRVNDEKSDGHFYGVSTINKIVREMVVAKLRSLAESKAAQCGECSAPSDAREPQDAESSEVKDCSSDADCNDATHKMTASVKAQPANTKHGTMSTTVKLSHEDRLITAKDLPSLVSPKSLKELTPEEKLKELIGIDSVRKQMDKILQEITKNGTENVDFGHLNIRFIGNPGTGRTEIARILGAILKERGVLKNGGFLEHDITDLAGCIEGETVPKTLAICRDAEGSVLFIDEIFREEPETGEDAEELQQGMSDKRESSPTPEQLALAKKRKIRYRREAMDALISEMKNPETHMLTVISGTEADMARLEKEYPELSSDMPYEIRFEDFSREELGEIYLHMAKRDRFRVQKGLSDEVMNYFRKLPDQVLRSGTFSNARYVRNLFERTTSKTLLREELGTSISQKREITSADFRLAADESTEVLNEKEPKRYPMGFHL